MNQPRTTRENGCSSIAQRNRVKDNKKITSANRRKAKDVKVLAERNEAVVPVGAWVESADECQEHPGIRAVLTEELLEETRREKEDSLRRFQDAVRKRVSQQARLRKQQQLLKSYETVSKVMRQVRHRLAACQTIQDGDELSQLPGGIWKISPARDKPESHISGDEKDYTEGANDAGEENEQDELPLAGQNDQLLHLNWQRSKTVTFQNDMAYEKRFREPYLTGSCTDYRSSQVLWPHESQEELKRQRQSQFLMHRRLFMDIEREQVKEHQKYRKHLKKTARIKNEKEQLRKAEEMNMERQRRQEEQIKEMAEREHLILERLRLDEEEVAEEVERRHRTKRIKETKRYIDATQALIKEKLEKDKVELPPLCCCGDTFWDSHPDTCANNCVFYNNPKAYAQALQSVLLSCDVKEMSLGQYVSTCKAASTHVHFQRK